MTLARRQFLAGLFVAPAIVRASSLMAIRPVNCLRNPDFSVWSIEYDGPMTATEVFMRQERAYLLMAGAYQVTWNTPPRNRWYLHEYNLNQIDVADGLVARVDCQEIHAVLENPIAESFDLRAKRGLI